MLERLKKESKGLLLVLQIVLLVLLQLSYCTKRLIDPKWEQRSTIVSHNPRTHLLCSPLYRSLAIQQSLSYEQGCDEELRRLRSMVRQARMRKLRFLRHLEKIGHQPPSY
jgi:hypothetical protein